MSPITKVAVICGSLRQQSYNGAVARSLPAVAPAGMAFVFLEGLDEIPHFNADLQKGGYPQRVQEWADAIAEADAVVIVTPEYNFSVPGVLKNALDWLSRLQPGPFERKPVAIQTASPGRMGGVRAQYHLRQIMVFLDANVLNKPEIIITDVASKIGNDGLLADAQTRAIIAEQLLALQRLAGGAHQSRNLEAIA